jgi:hypothetical protein
MSGEATPVVARAAPPDKTAWWRQFVEAMLLGASPFDSPSPANTDLADRASHLIGAFLGPLVGASGATAGFLPTAGLLHTAVQVARAAGRPSIRAEATVPVGAALVSLAFEVADDSLRVEFFAQSTGAKNTPVKGAKLTMTVYPAAQSVAQLVTNAKGLAAGSVAREKLRGQHSAELAIAYGAESVRWTTLLPTIEPEDERR